ncbi:hypothetical protein [Spirillospora sp. NPDC029432]|uniref:hypothetical protein n=1 Tax=Spirillospora sp. NPDC029432 TaxID=3154599 RepID=UPI0034532707
MQFIESSVIGVRATVLTLGRRTTPLRFVLFPMVHVAERSFYREVAARASECALIVAEGGPAGTMPVQERLAKLRHDHLVDQIHGLDLESLGVPVSWEYGPPAARPAASGADRLIRTTLDAAGAVHQWLHGRYGDPRDLGELDEAEGHDLHAGDHSEDGREQRLIRTLGRIHRERYTEDVGVAVIWGAWHMSAVVGALRADFRYHVRDAERLMVRAG